MPIPPPLVRILREHLEKFDMAKDVRLFASERGNVVAASWYSGCGSRRGSRVAAAAGLVSLGGPAV